MVRFFVQRTLIAAEEEAVVLSNRSHVMSMAGFAVVTRQDARTWALTPRLTFCAAAGAASASRASAGMTLDRKRIMVTPSFSSLWRQESCGRPQCTSWTDLEEARRRSAPLWSR